jgi:predicted N-acetyltransferase YhbS
VRARQWVPANPVSGGLKIEWLAAAEIVELQSFVREHMRPGHIFASDAELVRWQYRCPGDHDRLSMLVARDDDQIVGVLGLIVLAFNNAGRRASGGWLATWTVAPAARERQAGLSLLRHMLAEPLEFIGVLGVTETALRIYQALGFSIRESIPRWVRVISDDALAKLLGERYSPCGEPSRRLPARGSLRISRWTEAHAERWEELWERRLAPRSIGVWRDAAYLRWRYLEHPRFTYTVQVAEDRDGSLRGMVVYRLIDVRGAEGKVARIVDLHGDAEAMTALVSDVVATAVRAGAAFAEFFCSAGAVAGPLGACGFTMEPEPTDALPALVEPLNLELPARVTGAFRFGAAPGAGQAMFESDALYVTRSDCDQDRPQ